ncbi:MAG: hypothetical protein H8E60_01860 [Candidatus Marinimicrobia bacterium]|nr:hypothetical protein [Candidatus Neomarinimicrobiota bacterium]
MFIDISHRINKFLLFLFIIFSTLPAGVISKHYLGARLNIDNNEATFIDKIECKANPHWTFNLSSELTITAILINDKIRKFTKLVSGPSQTQYKIHRNFWEPKEALIYIEYYSSQSEIFYEIIPNQLVQLKASEYFYPTGNEFTSQFEFHLQIPSDWKLISDGNVMKIKNKQNSYKILSPKKITQLNLFFLKDYQETPQLNKLLLTLYSKNLANQEKDEIINNFFTAFQTIENLLGPFPFPKFDIILSEYEFESNSIIFINPLKLKAELNKLPNKILNQYYRYYLFPTDLSNLNWVEAIQIYLLDYLPALYKNPISAQLFRKEILNSNSKSITSNIFNDTLQTEIDKNEIQNYLFLLFTLEKQLGNENLINKLQLSIEKFAFNKVDKTKYFTFLFDELFNDMDFYLTERSSFQFEIPTIEIVESEQIISLLQPNKVLPMLLPVSYYFNNKTNLDSTLYTKSFKTTLANKIDSSLIKIEIDPSYQIFRTLNETEIDTKIKDIFNYSILQVSISDQISNQTHIHKLILDVFQNQNIIFTKFDELNSNLPSIIIGDLPNEFKYLSTETDIILNGRKFYLKNHCLTYAIHSQKNLTNLIIYSDSEKQIIPVLNKLKFFKNYGYFILRNGNNADKGVHKTHKKQLIWKK